VCVCVCETKMIASVLNQDQNSQFKNTNRNNSSKNKTLILIRRHKNYVRFRCKHLLQATEKRFQSVCLSVPPKLTGTQFHNHLPTHQNSLALSSTTIYPLTKTDRNSTPHSMATCSFIETEDYPECPASGLLDETGRSVEDDTQGGSVLDMSLTPGWYRFKLYGENAVMPTECRPVSLSILIVSACVCPRVTAVVRKRPRSFCQKCRWQVTAKHAYTLRMWLCMK